jgi:DNA-binding GntR family transcriptional regulator
MTDTPQVNRALGPTVSGATGGASGAARRNGAEPVAGSPDPAPAAKGARSGAALNALLAAIRDDLAAGSYHPRERLVEADLVARYGATRAAVRDALIQLTSEGIVERLPNRGARVRAMSIQEAVEIAEIRRMLEVMCTGRAARLATDAELRAFGATAEALGAASRSGNINDYLTLNARFHAEIRTMARHSIAQSLLDNFQRRPIDRFFPHEFRGSPPQASVDEHGRIASAVCARDVKGAEAAMYDHLTSLIDALRSFEPRS